MANEIHGFRKVLASELPVAEQEKLRALLRQELADSLIKAIQAEPADVDFAKIDVVLRPGQAAAHWHATADCATCSTCATCATCSTCATVAASPNVPADVATALGVKVGHPPAGRVLPGGGRR